MNGPVTWDLAAAGPITRLAVSAAQHAGTASGLPAGDIAALSAAGLLITGSYLLSCVPWPFGPCLACRWRPRYNPGSNGRRHGRCRICRGTGERIRFGTRLLMAVGYHGRRWP